MRLLVTRHALTGLFNELSAVVALDDGVHPFLGFPPCSCSCSCIWTCSCSSNSSSCCQWRLRLDLHSSGRQSGRSEAAPGSASAAGSGSSGLDEDLGGGSPHRAGLCWQRPLLTPGGLSWCGSWRLAHTWSGDGQPEAGELGQVDSLGVLQQQADHIKCKTDTSTDLYLLFLNVMEH